MPKKSKLPKVTNAELVEAIMENLTEGLVSVRERGDQLLSHQKRTDILSPTSRPPAVKGLRDQTFEVPINEVPKS